MMWYQGKRLSRKDGVFTSSVGLTRNDLRFGVVATWSKIFEPCNLGDVIFSLRAVGRSRIGLWMRWQKATVGLGWLQMQRMRSFTLQRTKTFVVSVLHSSRTNWQLRERKLMCFSSLSRKCMDVGMVPKGSVIL